MTNGHVKIARKAFATDRFWLEERAFSKWEAWVDMIQLAQWSPRKVVSTTYGTVDLNRGEFVASLRTLAKRWGWSFQSVRTFTESREFATRVAAQRVTPAGTVYLVVNYDKYQSTAEEHNTGNGTGASKESTQDQHRTNTRTSSKAGKAKDLTTLSDSSSDVESILAHYLAAHPRRRIGPKDRKAVANALTLGYTPAELCEAIDGNAADQWHREKHKHELPYVLRDTGKIDDFRERAAAALVPLVDDDGIPTEAGMPFFFGK